MTRTYYAHYQRHKSCINDTERARAHATCSAIALAHLKVNKWIDISASGVYEKEKSFYLTCSVDWVSRSWWQMKDSDKFDSIKRMDFGWMGKSYRMENRIDKLDAISSKTGIRAALTLSIGGWGCSMQGDIHPTQCDSVTKASLRKVFHRWFLLFVCCFTSFFFSSFFRCCCYRSDFKTNRRMHFLFHLKNEKWHINLWDIENGLNGDHKGV